MSFKLESNGNYSNPYNVEQCLSAWCKVMEYVTYESKGKVLWITKNNGEESTTVKVIGALAKHQFKNINELDAFGYSEQSKHFSLEISGTNEEGKSVEFCATMNIRNDGEGWSDLNGYGYFLVEGKRFPPKKADVEEEPSKALGEETTAAAAALPGSAIAPGGE